MAVLRLALFDHLLSNRKQRDYSNSGSLKRDPNLHPATIKLEALYSSGTIHSDDDRLTSLYCAFTNIIRDYTTPPKKIFREDFDKFVSKQVRMERQLTPSLSLYSLYLFPFYHTTT